MMPDEANWGAASWRSGNVETFQIQDSESEALMRPPDIDWLHQIIGASHVMRDSLLSTSLDF
jgi:hypothetical protein